MQVEPRFIEHVARNWEEDPQIQDMLEALAVEIKRRGRNCSEEIAGICQNLASQIRDREYWIQMDILLRTNFDF